MQQNQGSFWLLILGLSVLCTAHSEHCQCVCVCVHVCCVWVCLCFCVHQVWVSFASLYVLHECAFTFAGKCVWECRGVWNVTSCVYDFSHLYTSVCLSSVCWGWTLCGCALLCMFMVVCFTMWAHMCDYKVTHVLLVSMHSSVYVDICAWVWARICFYVSVHLLVCNVVYASCAWVSACVCICVCMPFYLSTAALLLPFPLSGMNQYFWARPLDFQAVLFVPIPCLLLSSLFMHFYFNHTHY